MAWSSSLSLQKRDCWRCCCFRVTSFFMANIWVEIATRWVLHSARSLSSFHILWPLIRKIKTAINAEINSLRCNRKLTPGWSAVTQIANFTLQIFYFRAFSPQLRFLGAQTIFQIVNLAIDDKQIDQHKKIGKIRQKQSKLEISDWQKCTSRCTVDMLLEWLLSTECSFAYMATCSYCCCM